MSNFILTPTGMDIIESAFKNSITGKWTIPHVIFNMGYTNPFYEDIDPLNDDPSYQKAVIDNFYWRLKEKWMYKDPMFRSLLKYFKVELNGDQGKISLITNIDDASKYPIDKKYRNFVFDFIEKYFVTKHLVSKTLKQYVKVSHIKWYDLYHNVDNIKSILCHKLKKVIISTIYKLEDENDDNFKNKKSSIINPNSRSKAEEFNDIKTDDSDK
jgi:hypothetical protein